MIHLDGAASARWALAAVAALWSRSGAAAVRTCRRRPGERPLSSRTSTFHTGRLSGVRAGRARAVRRHVYAAWGSGEGRVDLDRRGSRGDPVACLGSRRVRTFSRRGAGALVFGPAARRHARGLRGLRRRTLDRRRGPGARSVPLSAGVRTTSPAARRRRCSVWRPQRRCDRPTSSPPCDRAPGVGQTREADDSPLRRLRRQRPEQGARTGLRGRLSARDSPLADSVQDRHTQRRGPLAGPLQAPQQTTSLLCRRVGPCRQPEQPDLRLLPPGQVVGLGEERATAPATSTMQRRKDPAARFLPALGGEPGARRMTSGS